VIHKKKNPQTLIEADNVYSNSIKYCCDEAGNLYLNSYTALFKRHYFSRTLCLL